MKRFHVHVAVSNLEQSTGFYSAMFGVQPTVLKPDYAKWMLDDPRINFAISERAGVSGINHLGIQAESDAELEEIHARLQTASANIAAEKNVNCCYATSDKYWVNDPAGIAWESFRSLDNIPFYSEQGHQGAEGAEDTEVNAAAAGTACTTSCCPAIAPKTDSVTSAAKACCNG